jgi:hypothetical protein
MKTEFVDLKIPAFAFALLVLAGCAGMQQAPEEVVLERAQARWDALLTGNLAEAYEYLSPGYRSAVSLNSWQRAWLTQKINRTGARVTESDCAEDTCNVTISIDYVLIGAIPGVGRLDKTTTIDEDWVRVSGQWYHLPRM